MAHYRETKSGKWEVEVYLGINPSTGKPKYKSKRFKRKRDAKDWANQKEIDKNMGIIVDASNYTVKKYLNEWIEDHKINLSPNTYDSYNMIIQTHLIPALGNIKLEKLGLEKEIKLKF